METLEIFTMLTMVIAILGILQGLFHDGQR